MFPDLYKISLLDQDMLARLILNTYTTRATQTSMINHEVSHGSVVFVCVCVLQELYIFFVFIKQQDENSRNHRWSSMDSDPDESLSLKTMASQYVVSPQALSTCSCRKSFPDGSLTESRASSMSLLSGK